jgi:hypothetical protein
MKFLWGEGNAKNVRKRQGVKNVDMSNVCKVLVTALCFSIAACDRVEGYGDMPKLSDRRTSIASILVEPAYYLHEELVIEGTIVNQSPTGEWIDIENDGGRVMTIDLKQASVPKRIGKRILVKGTLVRSSEFPREVRIQGSGILVLQ